MQAFLADIPPKQINGTYFGYVLRAPIARGRIRGLRPPSLPEGYFLVRARDIPGKRTLSCAGFTHPVLGDPQVQYQGQPFALLCGPEREILAELAGAVKVEWEVQPVAENPGEDPAQGPREARPGPPPGPAAAVYRRGDPEAAFQRAFQIVEAEYGSGRRRLHDPDLPGAFVRGSDKSMTVYASTQDPFGLREALAAVLKLPPRRVRVVATRLGNPLEGKFLQSALVAAHAALLAAACKKPVWLGIDAEEEFRFGFPGPGFRIRQRTALDREGKPVAARLELEMDSGAYEPEAESILMPAVRSSCGAYRVPNIEILGRAVCVNKLPTGSFRAAGRAQAFFAAELNSCRLEEISELDPYTWKSRYLLRGALPTGSRPEEHGEGRKEGSGAPQNVLEAAVGMANYRRKHAAFAALKKRRPGPLDPPFPLRGIGLAMAYQEAQDPGIHVTRPHSCTVKAVLDTDRRLHLYTSFVDYAPGIHDLLARRAAQLLEMDVEKVTVEEVDTQVVPDTGATTLGRVMSVGLPLIEQCCQAVRNRRIKSLLPIEVRRSCRQPAPGGPDAEGMRPVAPPGAAWAATVVEAEVDPVSLEVTVRGIWIALACGSLDGLPNAERYVIGEVIRAAGWASLPEPTNAPASTGPGTPGWRPAAAPESLHYPSWRAGSLPRLSQVPPVFARFVDGPNPTPRGFEQLPYLTVPAAYAVAVSQATGLYIDRIPITPEVLQECLET